MTRFALGILILGTGAVAYAAGTAPPMVRNGGFIIPVPTNPIAVQTFGARCDGRTDDTAAFQRAVDAASKLYASIHKSVTVSVSGTCVVADTVVVSSGVMISGPGTVVVPCQYSANTPAACHSGSPPPSHIGPTFEFENADNAGVTNLTINVSAGPGGLINNGILSAIHWTNTNTDAIAHVNFSVTGCKITNSDWGILVNYAPGSGSLTNVTISSNEVTSPAAYQLADGIHVNGRVNNITINDNTVNNRGDAAIAISSSGSSYDTGGTNRILNNHMNEDLCGIDLSGPANVLVQGNTATATVAAPASKPSNPSFRSIFEHPGNDVTPRNITVIGNTFINGPSPIGEVAAKIDDSLGNATPTNLVFTTNTVGSMWVRGTQVILSGNSFVPNSTINIRGCTSATNDCGVNIPSTQLCIYTNTFQSNGAISVGPTEISALKVWTQAGSPHVTDPSHLITAESGSVYSSSPCW
jgi:hypothetical protein